MERLNWHLADELQRQADVCAVAPRGSAACAPEGVAVVEVVHRPIALFLLAALWKSVWLARRVRPVSVIAGSGLIAPIAWLAARLSRARAIVYLHGLDIALKNIVYRAAWLPAIRRMDRVFANSRATAQLARDSGVRRDRIAIIPPGVHVDVAGPGNGEAFRGAFGLGPGPILLSVGRLTERKGLREFVSDVLPQVVASCGEVQLVVVGDEAHDALVARSQSRESIQAAADAHGVGNHIRFLGPITDWNVLSHGYRAAAVHVFPVREIPGDPEGFGMVAIEAAAHGLPTAAYATGGIVDAVSDGVSGRLVAPGDGAALGLAIVELLTRPLPMAPMIAFARGFAWSRFGERMRNDVLSTPTP
jgi:phosphatidylinositol alpha-1,6-mannosyltransferase